MKNLVRETQQAFYFSLGFYGLALLWTLLKLPFAAVLLSIALLVSLIWVVLVLRELMLSTKLNDGKRMLFLIFIIFGNVFAGVVYFFFLREQVIGQKLIKK
ncbi:hypothetical protein [Sphingobacterium sp. MYb382]|uniref:hypothetical protein n=1 Tax=Sphingobacterium sp. MYb382 TaxID=2745278 RepID=UPI0030A1F23E